MESYGSHCTEPTVKSAPFRKPQGTLFVTLFSTMRIMWSKVNFTSLGRYSELKMEKSYSAEPVSLVVTVFDLLLTRPLGVASVSHLGETRLGRSQGSSTGTTSTSTALDQTLTSDSNASELGG